MTLIAVSKTVSIELIREAYDAGHRHFGESRVQEALPKIAALPGDIVWHFIGKLQSNKARRAAEAVHVLHTLENERQLIEIAKAHRTVEGFIEVNLAREPQKSGVLSENLDALIAKVADYPQVLLRGLMTVGPYEATPDEKRVLFRALKGLAREELGLVALSMGMSADYEIAIQEGSTHVRVGSAIFGDRA